MIRVLLADDETLIRAGFRAILDTAVDITVAAEAADGAEAVARASDCAPDVILMDIRVPGMDGLEATRHISCRAGITGPRVIILTTYEADEYVSAAIRAGVRDSSSRTPNPPTCCTQSGSSPPVRDCSPPASPDV